MSVELAKAYVQIIPSAEGITGGIEKALGDGEPAGRKFGSGLTKGIGTAAKVGVAGMAALAAGTVAAGTAFVNAAKSTAEYGDNIDKQSQKLSVSAEQYQVLAFAAEHSGTSIDKFQKAAATLANNGFEGSVYDAVSALQAIEDPAERAAAASEMFGERTAMEIAPLINGEMAMEDYANQLSELGGIMSDDAVANSAAFEDAMTNLHTAFSGFANGILSEALPGMTLFSEGLAGLVSGQEGAAEQMAEGVTQIVDAVVQGIPLFMDAVVQIGAALLEQAPTIIESLVNGIVANGPQLMTGMTTALQNLGNAIMAHLPQMLTMGLQLLVKLAVGVVNAIPQLVSKIPQIFSAFKSAFTAIDWASVGRELINGIIRGIGAAASMLFDSLKNLAHNALNAAKNVLGIHSPSTVFRDEVGKFVPAGIAVGIEDNADVVEDAVARVGTLSVNGLRGANVSNYGGITINVNGAGDPSVVADKVSRVILNRMNNMGASWA